jgi:hypothetical protein
MRLSICNLPSPGACRQERTGVAVGGLISILPNKASEASCSMETAVVRFPWLRGGLRIVDVRLYLASPLTKRVNSPVPLEAIQVSPGPNRQCLYELFGIRKLVSGGDIK